jgi:hypothetical protein
MKASDQFNKFAGREVGVVETPFKTEFKNLGITYEGVHVEINKDDPAITELSAAVKAAGLHLRLWLPDSMGTMDYRLDRLNVHIRKEDDGKYRIQPGIGLG